MRPIAVGMRRIGKASEAFDARESLINAVEFSQGDLVKSAAMNARPARLDYATTSTRHQVPNRSRRRL